MKRMNKGKKLGAFLLVVLLCLINILPVNAKRVEETEKLTMSEAADEETITEIIYISDARDYYELAENCILDTWSQGKKVILQNDIALDDTEFVPIPAFGGIFEGNGYTIHGITMEDSMSPYGLFRVVLEGAQIRNVNVSAVIAPSGTADIIGGITGENYGQMTGCTFTGTVKGKSNVGGIAGINYESGWIQDCSVSGEIVGDYMTGGMVGYNKGIIVSSENKALINIVSVDPSMKLDEMDVNFTLDVSKITSLDTNAFTNDTGGIAGYSTGVVEGCVNKGTIGYPHIGYNVGGIVGRSSGYIYRCENQSDIYGRKDVGGIVGQIEPDIILILSEDYIENLGNQLENLSQLVDEAGENADDYGTRTQTELNNITRHQNNAKQALDELKPVKGEIKLPNEDAIKKLTESVNGMMQSTKKLGDTAKDGTQEMTSDLTAISDQISAISDTLSMATDDMKNAQNEEVVDDTSERGLDQITIGKVYQSLNSGSIQADLNVGGIVGAMALEYELDPEDDVTAGVSGTRRRTYELKSIVQECENIGEIISKRNYAGGICGRMELGLVTDSENYGDVISKSGDYVGGIVGGTGGTIKNSYSKCLLSGGKYVGGIVGAGVKEDRGGEPSRVENCYSMVRIDSYEEFAGAIAGTDAGTYLYNYFVSDTLAGINQMSYGGKAESISYEALLNQPSFPEKFRELTLTFRAEDDTVKELAFAYGASFGEDIYPEIPQKAGYYAQWDKPELKDLHFDTVVKAIYTPFMTALPSTECRENGQPILFAEGQFDEGGALILESADPTPEAFDIFSKDTKDFIKRSFQRTKISREIVEQWDVRIPEDGQENHIIRYLTKDSQIENTDIYVKRGHAWEKVEVARIGSYLAFEITGTESEFAAISTMSVWWMWILAGILLLMIAIVATKLIRKFVKVVNRLRNKRK